MRLISLTLTGIGPFAGREHVDFAALTRSGLFLIEGPTGAGKSTIIDAIVFALYGDVSGSETSKDRIRSDLCTVDDPSEVVLEFEVGGVLHRITRNPAYERAKARGTGTTKENARQLLEIPDGSVPAMKDAKEIGVYIRQRLGLSAEHFRQLVVLPQGEFDALLRATPRQRFEVLGSLIDDGFLARVQEDLRDRADEAIAVRTEALTQSETILGHIRERITETDPDLLDPESALDAPAVVEVIAEFARRAETAREHLTQTSAQAATASEAATLAEQTLMTARATTAAIQRRDQAREAAARWDPDWSTADAEHLRRTQAEMSARRARLEPLAQWEADEPKRAARAKALADNVARATARVSDLRAATDALPERRIQADLAVAQAERAVAEEPAAQAAVDHVKALRTASADLATAQTALDQARQADAIADKELETQRRRLQTARTEANNLLRGQLDQRAAHLAALLVDGDACPVCGSVEHPAPAADPDTELITDDDVAAADARVQELEQAEGASAQRRTATLEAIEVAAHGVADARARLGDTDLTVLDEQLRAAEATLTQLRTSAQALEPARKARQQVEHDAADVAAQLEDAVVAATTASNEQRAERERIAAAQAALAEQVGDDTTATALLERLTSQADALEELLAALESVAAYPAGIDPATASAKLEEASQRRKVADAAAAAAQAEHARIDGAHHAVTGLAERWNAACTAAADIVAEVEPVIALGDLVSARSAANVRKTTLQAYAVQRRFRAVLAAASLHLERMSSGHYAFVLETEASRGQAGLGIAVHDLWTGRERDPATLSGGETFYASLSLALGLADVVREENGGVDLQTLFVDEGFGSLDQDSLELVLDQLDALRSRGRTVGVISHVTEMKEWVHDRLEVIPDAPGQGSHISQTGL